MKERDPYFFSNTIKILSSGQSIRSNRFKKINLKKYCNDNIPSHRTPANTHRNAASLTSLCPAVGGGSIPTSRD
jgi:hypothetical protein